MDGWPGSSPRVRSGLGTALQNLGNAGIISACAERSTREPIAGGVNGDHLRVCGAVQLGTAVKLAEAGSSPRVRSGRVHVEDLRRNPGIISACAERSANNSALPAASTDHLRVCGAVRVRGREPARGRGSSPRVRSGHAASDGLDVCLGIISACAERSDGTRSPSAPHWDHLRVCGAVSCILLGFGPVGWCGMFDSYVVRGRGVALFSIFGMDAFDICYARQPATDMGSAGGRRLSEEL